MELNNLKTVTWRLFLILGISFLFSLQLLASESCKTGEFVNDQGTKTAWQCGCAKPSGTSWVDVGNSCYHKMACTTGDFINEKGEQILYSCGCEDQDLTGWTKIQTGCYHKVDIRPETVKSPSVSNEESTIESAKDKPEGSFFAGSIFAGVFDTRNSETSALKIINSKQTQLTGIGKCLSNNQDIGFSFMANDNEAIMQSLKIAPGGVVFFKVIIPPGAGSVETRLVSHNWGMALTTVAGHGQIPSVTDGQLQGKMPPVFTGSLNQKEKYATVWIYNKNNFEIKVSLVTTVFKILDSNIYNQWFARTTSKNCGGSSGGANVGSFFGKDFGSVPLPQSEDVAFKTQGKYRDLKNVQNSLILGRTSYAYFKLTGTFGCDPWKSQTTSSNSCLPNSFWQTSTGQKKIRILIPPGVGAFLDIHAAAVVDHEMFIGVHSTPNPNSTQIIHPELSPSVQFLEGFTSMRQNLNIGLQLVNEPRTNVSGAFQPVSVSKKAQFTYVTFESPSNIDYPISQFNLNFIVYDKQLLTNWLNSCQENDINNCVNK